METGKEVASGSWLENGQIMASEDDLENGTSLA